MILDEGNYVLHEWKRTMPLMFNYIFSKNNLIQETSESKSGTHAIKIIALPIVPGSIEFVWRHESLFKFK